LKQLKRVYIEITNMCNLSCSFCPKLSRPAREMSVPEFKRVLDEISPHTDYVYLHLKGEPLLHPYLAQILALCKEYNIKATITTNGTLLKEKKDILVNSSALSQLNISLHSFENPTSNKEIYEVYLHQAIDAVKELNHKTNTILAFRLWNLEKLHFQSSLLEKNLMVIEKLEKEFALDYSICDQLLSLPNHKRGIKLANNIYLNQDYEFTWPSLDTPFISDSGYCYGLKTQIGILSNGTVVPCCLDGEGDINLGNIFSSSFLDILNSTRATKIAQGFACRNVIEPLCKHCGYRSRFGS
jgi:radical SAM protein with 4Fe4S-binding SPASM domain